jgi:hypothetical protein
VKPLEDLRNTFWCLMTKGEKYQLKCEGPALLCSVLFCLERLDCLVLQTRLSGFTQHNFLSIISLPSNSGLEDMLYCVNFGVKACNMFVNLNYACSCVLVVSYPLHDLFMQICTCECLEIIGVTLVNMLSLEKLNVPVLETGCSSFCGFANKTG